MNFFQFLLIFFLGSIFTRTLYFLFEIIFIQKKINYQFYFFLSGFFAFNFILTYLIPTFHLPNDAYILIKKWSFVSKNLMVLTWLYAYYDTHFPKSRIPFIFLITSAVILSTVPFSIFLSKPAILVNINVFNQFTNLGIGSPHLMYYIGDFNLVVFSSIITSIKLFYSKKTVFEKIIGFSICIGGLNFLIDSIILYSYSNNITLPWLLSYQFILISGFGFIFLIPNVESYVRIKNTLVKMKEDNVRLKKVVDERTKEIVEKNRQKTNLFVNLTHEFKTPLSIIQNYLNEYINENKKTKKLEIIKTNIDKLSSDVINFLDTEKIEMGRIIYQNYKIIDLGKYIKEALSLYQEYVKYKNILFNYHVDEGVMVKADPLAIDRILNNLLDNAIKYTNENGSS